MKDFRDFLTGENWEQDLATGLFLPPHTREDDLYEVQGGPRHASNPSPFYFVSRRPNLVRAHTDVRSVAGFEFRGDRVYRWVDGERVEQRGLGAIRARVLARAVFGEFADLAGIEPE